MGIEKSLIPVERIEKAILLIRGQKVMLDADLAALYGVKTKVLLQAVKRNLKRFPFDFMFQLTAMEFTHLRSQTVTSSSWGGRRYAPYAFTEHGAIMAANVLNSHRAVEAGVLVVRAFVRLRRMLATHHELAQKLAELERKIGTHDEAIQGIMDAIHELMEPPAEPHKEQIGFRPRKGLSGSEDARVQGNKR